MTLTFKRLDSQGWEDVQIQDIKEHDVIAAYNDGVRHKDEKGRTEWTALSDAYQVNGEWCFLIEKKLPPSVLDLDEKGSEENEEVLSAR